MPNTSRPALERAGVHIVLLVALAMPALVALAMPASASAAGSFMCDASALRATVFGGQTIEPITANRGQAACRTANASVVDTSSLPAPLPLPAPVTAKAVIAKTAFDQQSATASGGITDLRVSALPALPIPADVQAALAQADQSIDAVPPIVIPLLGVTADVRPALRAMLPSGQVPGVDVVSVQTALADASAACVNGVPKTSGTSKVAGVRVLGQEVPAGQAVDQAVTLVDTTNVDPSNIDLSKITFSGGAVDLGNPTVLAQVQAAVQPALDAIPTISIPATVGHVKVTPGGQAVQDGKLTQRALQVQVSIAGQTIADLVLGEASVGAAGVDCAGAAVAANASGNELQLRCSKRKLVLIDVLRRGRRVKLLGAADTSLVGRRVSIVFTGDHKVVAHAKVARDGGFHATAPLPRASIRNTNRARYQAVVGRERSLDLKLARRMLVRSVSAEGRKVTIEGRVVLPLASPIATITVKRRVTCSRSEVVKRIKPDDDGTFRVTITAPRNRAAAVYRLQTQVRKNRTNPKRFPTFTLPRAVDFR